MPRRSNDRSAGVPPRLNRLSDVALGLLLGLVGIAVLMLVATQAR